MRQRQDLNRDVGQEVAHRGPAVWCMTRWTYFQDSAWRRFPQLSDERANGPRAWTVDAITVR